MATPAEVIDLFADVRDGSSFERARAAANAFRAFASLSASQKRDLAILVAERSAPQLVPKIQAETGLDLTREQVQAVIEMAGRMDAEDIEELRRSVQDDQARSDAVRTVGTSAATAAAAATGLDDVVAAPEEAPDEASGEAPDEVAQDPPPDGDSELDDDTPLGIDQSELDELGVEAELVELDHEPEPTAPVAPAPEPRPFESVFDDLPDMPAFEQRAGGGTMTPERTRTRVLEHLPTAAPVDLTTRVRAARQPLVEALREQTGGAGCVRLVRAHLDDLVDMDAVSRTAVVDAVPDGWARRRTVQAMLEGHVLPASEVPDLIRRVTSPVARAWLCATAVEVDMLDVDQLDDILEPRAAARLRGRYR